MGEDQITQNDDKPEPLARHTNVIIINKNIFYSTSSKSSQKIIVDGSNVAWDGARFGEMPKIGNILLIIDALKNRGFKDIIVIPDASLKYKIDDKKYYEEMIAKKQIDEAPAGSSADRHILNYSKEFNAKVVTNDRYLEWIEQDVWVKKNIEKFRVTFMIKDGQVSFTNLEESTNSYQTPIDHIINNKQEIEKTNNLTKSEDTLPQYYDISKLISDYNLSDYHGKDVVGLFNQALSIFNKASTHNEFLNAIGSFSQIISINRRYMPAYLYRAYASTRISGFEAAIKDFTVAIEYNPEFYQAYIDRGNAYLELKQFDEAIRSFTWVIDHDPTNQIAKTLREKAYARKSKIIK